MKIEWGNKTKAVPFSKLKAGQCFLSEEDSVCLVCMANWAVVLATGEMFEVKYPDDYEVRLISAKVVVLEIL